MAMSRVGRSGVFASMGRLAVLALVAAACLLPGGRASALRLPSEDQSRRVRVHAMWNRQYLCLAARVPDVILTGTSSGPMSTPEQDDAIEFSLEIPGQPEISAYRLVISASGGMTLLSRDSRGHWRTDAAWISGPRTLKYAVATDGTLNDPNDADEGYVVECAIPWEFLREDGLGGAEIGFNVVCWMQGENEGVASWSSSVRDPAEVGDAARWGKMLIRAGSGLAKAVGAWVPCPYVGQVPFIDGRLAADEWLAAATLEFDKPEPVIEPMPLPAEKTGVTGALLAVYRYDWQGVLDSGEGAPLWTSDGAPATSHQPRSGAGPWISYQRVDWHAEQLKDVQRAGIDIILARYCGDERARRTWARTGLERLAQALKERRAAGLGYPLVGMMLDTSSLAGMDLRSEEEKQRLYGMIREFFLRLPSEFWAEVGARRQEGLAGGVPVLLGEPSELAGWDGSFVDFCQDRFAADFGGARLVWLGSGAWRTGGAELYAYIELPTETGFAMSSPDGARAVALSPGYCPPPGRSGRIRDRMEGKAYRTEWQRALASKPELVIINSWNDYATGTEIAPSRQYGVIYVDTTRYFQSRLGSQQPHHLWLKQQRLPELLAPGVDYQVEFLVENVGTEDLRTGRRVSVDYEIRRLSDGAIVRRKASAQRLSVAAGQTSRLPVIISTKDDRGDPLPAGEYLYVLRVVRSKVAYFRSQWFARTIADLAVPFHVGELPAHRATVVSTSLPAAMEVGATRHVVVRLRNDGAAPWRPGEVRLSYHWVRYRDDLELPFAEAREMVAWEGMRAELPGDVRPGEIVSVMIPVSALAADGESLPPSAPEDLWHYRIQWDLVAGEDGWFSSQGRDPGEEAIQLAPSDSAASFESVAVPVELNPEEIANIDIVVANAGSRTWHGGEDALTYRWYRWDGRPTASAGAGTASVLPVDVAPGERVLVTASLVAPAMPGPYWLTWDLVTRDDTGEAQSSSQRRDLAVSPVFVRPTKVHPIELSAYANVRAIAADGYRARGDFDGRGSSLPAEWLPPDQTGPREHMYPDGYYAPGKPGTDIPFAFPAVNSGVGAAVACSGQSIPLGERGAVQVHIVIASTEGARPTTFHLTDDSGEVHAMTVAVPPWDEQVEGAPMAAYCPYVRTLSGDDSARGAYLYHLTLSPPSGTAISLGLPREPWIKLLAVTVEEP